MIKIPELKISKLHAVIFYDKHEKSFMVKDLGSVNGTFLNKDQRLCEVNSLVGPAEKEINKAGMHEVMVVNWLFLIWKRVIIIISSVLDFLEPILTSFSQGNPATHGR